MRDGDWKLYAKAKENLRPNGIQELTKEDKRFFLVNLKEDPGEKRNWAVDYPERVRTLTDLAMKNQADLEESQK